MMMVAWLRSRVKGFSQCSRKKSFSVVKSWSELPMMGRRVVDIWRVTRRKMASQISSGVVLTTVSSAFAVGCLSILKRKPAPKKRAMSQVMMTRVPKKAVEAVDCEKTQSTGVKPSRRVAMREREAAIPCAISRRPRVVPVRAEKM